MHSSKCALVMQVHANGTLLSKEWNKIALNIYTHGVARIRHGRTIAPNAAISLIDLEPGSKQNAMERGTHASATIVRVGIEFDEVPMLPLPFAQQRLMDHGGLRPASPVPPKACLRPPLTHKPNPPGS